MDLQHIRNFSIIAHIDHGKSTLADRLLELTHTIETRKMRDQVLDKMDLERERGITIKMTPVRMEYQLPATNYTLNLIDTPGHIDFSYEVSRALQAVEGSLLLVDATQGVQAQTLTTLSMARDLGLTIIPVVSKIDSPLADIKNTREELAKLLGVKNETVIEVSGRTGANVEKLLEAVVERIPAPREELPGTESFRGLIFDFEYSNHQGIILYTRILDGTVKRGEELRLLGANEKCTALEVGIFNPDKKAKETLGAGEIGYIVTGIKKPGIASVGDTVTLNKKPLPALPGYQNPRPVVWASIYPESQDDFTSLKTALERLKLSDSSFSFEEESSGVLGRGYRAGFLGMLHLEIITERLKREFNISIIITTPSINYEVEYLNGKKGMVYSPSLFPDHGTYKEVREPWVKMKIITPPEYLSPILQMLYDHEAEIGDTESFGEKE